MCACGQLDEIFRLVRLAIPLREVCALVLEEAVDRVDDVAQHLAVAFADPRIGKKILLEDVAEEQALGDAEVVPQPGLRCGRFGSGDAGIADSSHESPTLVLFARIDEPMMRQPRRRC